MGTNEPLAACLDHIGRSRLPERCELIVVDDSAASTLTAADLPSGTELRSTGGLGSAAAARNVGAAGFTGRFLLFVDADVEVEPSCLDRLVAPLRAGAADATVGNYSLDVGGHGFASACKQLYVAGIYGRRTETIRNDYWTAIAAVRADLFFSLGGFDAHYRGACGEDAEFGIRMTAVGARIVAVADARGRHLKRFTLPALVRNDWRKGCIAMRNYYRSSGSLADNRHASRRDIAASLLATTPVPAIGGGLAGLPWAAAALLLALGAAAYVLLRLDLARLFATRGPIFLVEAMATMMLLDLVRLVCVAQGVVRQQVATFGRSSGAMTLEAHPPLGMTSLTRTGHES